MRVPIALAFACTCTSAPSFAANLNLICGGGGSANRTQSTNVYATDSSGNSGSATILSRHDRAFEDQVNVEIRGSEGRIRLPRTMLPPVHGGAGGWMRLTDIHETSDEITAKAVVNFMSHPDVRLDRVSGTISISGRIGQYSGRCEAYDPASVERRF